MTTPLSPSQIAELRERRFELSVLERELLATVEHLQAQWDELSMAVGRFEGGLDLLAIDLGCGTNWPVARKLIENKIDEVRAVIHVSLEDGDD